MESISYNSPRRRLIVSADDFGISSRANRNILYLITLGKIDRVGIMINGSITQSEAHQLSRSGIKLDIHLDLFNDFKDKDKSKSVSIRLMKFIYNLFTGKFSSANVSKQWTNQIENFKKVFGKYPDGISSHEHIHFFPPFFSIAIKLGEEYNIPYIRFGEKNSFEQSKVSWILNILRITNRQKFKKTSLVSSFSLISLDWIKNLDEKLENFTSEKTLEIACHPELAEDFVKIKKYF